MKIIPLSEGSFTIDNTKLFVPYNPQVDELNERPVGSLLVEVQPFAVVTSKDVLVLDTGLGFNIDGQQQIYKNLLANGIDPKQVTKVLLTHLHKDHAGGVAFKDNLGQYHLSFPAATYYVQQKELDYALETGSPSFITEEFAILRNNPNVKLLPSEGVIDGYIRYQHTGGHSPFHQAFWIEEDGETIFFGGDEAPQLGQMKRKVIAKYDYDGRKSNDLRQQWWEQGSKENWTFLFYHDVKKPIWPES